MKRRTKNRGNFPTIFFPMETVFSCGSPNNEFFGGFFRAHCWIFSGGFLAFHPAMASVHYNGPTFGWVFHYNGSSTTGGFSHWWWRSFSYKLIFTGITNSILLYWLFLLTQPNSHEIKV